ncbi:DUF4177 domain-containing protein [Opitutus sp. ER46]|uniref:DUF4177 domain-containing protein n=1 Tax=Opitutus sp. ER46 TaxID=2161864 RepID=UPI000D324403|nr:DUF4177 domain-containing protein [Opitutus sp. ER46]PTX95824.1 hypothetical protein DB354_08700 [Opitutus sp. ER46]
MSLWEYKVITSGKGGFATPALLEKFLNDLGREEWEIIQFHTQPDNFLAFTGLARRPTQRDWTLEDAAAAAAKAEADKLRAEFEAKFKAATTTAAAGTEEAPASFLEEKVAPDDGLRKLVDTSRDADADADEDEKDEDDWDKLTAAEEDELPTFFDAIKPHMRRNQRGPGMSVGVDYLAKKWDQSEEDLKGALVECGFTIPEDEDAKAEYLEFEGDLYWINVNRRGELWINTKEKPRPVFRAVKAQKIAVEEPAEAPKQEGRGRRHEERAQKTETVPKPEGEASAPAATEAGAAPAGTEAPAAAEAAPEAATPGQPLPEGPALLEKIRPLMRRNRRGPGGSGSASFLSRALKCREADLVAGFKALGLVVPASANEKPVNVEIGGSIWWVNVDSRGNVWINGRDKKPGETIESGVASADASATPTTEGAAAPAATEPATDSAAPVVPAESVPASATPVAVPAPEVAPAATVEAAATTVAPTEPAPVSAAEPAVAAASSPSAEASAPAPVEAPVNPTLASVRGLLKETRSGALAGKLERLAADVGKSPEEFAALMVSTGLIVPDKPREKPVYVASGAEQFWLSRNARGELWLNAKPARKADTDESETDGEAEADAGDRKTRRPRSRRSKSDEGSTES